LNFQGKSVAFREEAKEMEDKGQGERDPGLPS